MPKIALIIPAANRYYPTAIATMSDCWQAIYFSFIHRKVPPFLNIANSILYIHFLLQQSQ